MPSSSWTGVPSRARVWLRVGFGLGARGRRRKGLAERKCWTDRWLWEE